MTILQFCMSRQAIGRSNEVTQTIWRSWTWDSSVYGASVDWNQRKTGQQDLMSFFNDRDCFELDPLQALANYIIRSDSLTRSNEFMFPKIHLMYQKF